MSVLVLWLLVTVGTVGLAAVSEAHLNLFMNESETKRLLGIDGELYYVRNGMINDYALSFNLPIKSDTDVIYFDWQCLRKLPPDPIMIYRMNVTVSNPRAMHQPTMSIDSDGQVPLQPSVFSVRLQCTRLISAEVDVKISINVNLFSTTNFSTLELRRRKTCLRNDFYDKLDKDFSGDLLLFNEFASATAIASQSPLIVDKMAGYSSHVFYIGVGCTCGIIVVIALSVLLYYVRSRKASTEHFSETSSASALSHDHVYQRADTPCRSITSAPSTMKHVSAPVSVTELRPTEVRQYAREIAIARSCVTLGSVILEGTFGRVYFGTLLTSENDSVMEQSVLVKTVTDQARHDQVDVMLKEGCLTKGLKHPNVNCLLATCFDPEDQPLLIYPFLDEGNLKKFLHRCKISDVGLTQNLNTQQLVYMAIQITRGILYLHRRHILHKDIATRNCLVDSQLTVKLTDNALARDLFPRDYHCLGDNENRPVKWLAIEALVDRKFSPASDMWSFGVTLWELMTLGQEPYVGIDPFEMATYLMQGYRVSQPANCPNELFAIMACCWSSCPDERPKFTQLQLCLQDFYATLSRFV